MEMKLFLNEEDIVVDQLDRQVKNDAKSCAGGSAEKLLDEKNRTRHYCDRGISKNNTKKSPKGRSLFSVAN
jgi:hypothetical protein